MDPDLAYIPCLTQNFDFRIVGLSVNEILSVLGNDNSIPETGRRIIPFPPADEGNISDEDSDEEDDMVGVTGMDINHLGPGMLSAQGEIEFEDPDDELPDIQQV